MKDDNPVSCDLQAYLEEIFTQKRQCSITYREQSAKLTQVRGQIVALYAAKGTDWCKLSEGTVINLALIEEFESWES